MDLSLNDEQLRAVIAKTILETLTPEVREKLLTTAIQQSLLTPPPTSSYDRKPVSPLQEAFNRAVGVVADQLIREQLSQSAEFKANVEKLFADVAARLFEGPTRAGMVEKMADTIVAGLKVRDY